MSSTPPALARIAPRFALIATLLLAAGCASDDGRPRRGAGKHREPFPTLAGHETFFQGGITAEVLVGAMTGFDLQAPDGGSGERNRGGGGMHLRRGGGMHAGAPLGQDTGGGDYDIPGRQQALAARRADNLGSPPVMIHLRFVNRGPGKADIVIADFLSPLGNFVVQPEKFSLEPGLALAVEPMTSRLASEISSGEISLTLKSGGVKETKTIALALQPEPAAPPPDVSHTAK